jgi:hypothetical protein
MNIINKLQSRHLLRTAVVPEATRYFRSLLHERGNAEAESATRDAMARALAEHRDAFPQMTREQGEQIVDLYAELCATSFAEEFKKTLLDIGETEH